MNRLKATIAGLCILTLTACSSLGTDGFFFKHKEESNNNINVSVVEYPDQSRLHDKAKEYSLDLNGKLDIYGFNVYKPSENTCIIHIVDPEKTWMPEILGHELAHCIYGKWHGNGVSGHR